MADKLKPPPPALESGAQQQPQQLPPLTHFDVLSVMRGRLGELNGYLSQPPQAIDPQVVVAKLEQIAHFALFLPSPRPAPSLPPGAEGTKRPN